MILKYPATRAVSKRGRKKCVKPVSIPDEDSFEIPTPDICTAAAPSGPPSGKLAADTVTPDAVPTLKHRGGRRRGGRRRGGRRQEAKPESKEREPQKVVKTKGWSNSGGSRSGGDSEDRRSGREKFCSRGCCSNEKHHLALMSNKKLCACKNSEQGGFTEEELDALRKMHKNAMKQMSSLKLVGSGMKFTSRIISSLYIASFVAEQPIVQTRGVPTAVPVTTKPKDQTADTSSEHEEFKLKLSCYGVHSVTELDDEKNNGKSWYHAKMLTLRKYALLKCFIILI